MSAQLELVQPAPLELGPPRADHEAIALLVPEGARVLDVGCGDGALITLLSEERRARVRGLELDQIKVHGCVRRGLSVVQADAERDLEAFPSASFDVVVFSHSLLTMKRPEAALRQGARIGERVIVSIENAGHWRTRLRMFAKGRLAPKAWDDAPQRACTLRDFAEMAASMRLSIERATPLSGTHAGAPFAKTFWRANWFAEQAVFLLAT